MIYRVRGRILDLAYLVSALQFIVKLLGMSLLFRLCVESLHQFMILLLRIVEVNDYVFEKKLARSKNQSSVCRLTNC